MLEESTTIKIWWLLCLWMNCDWTLEFSGMTLAKESFDSFAQRRGELYCGQVQYHSACAAAPILRAFPAPSYSSGTSWGDAGWIDQPGVLLKPRTLKLQLLFPYLSSRKGNFRSGRKWFFSKPSFTSRATFRGSTLQWPHAPPTVPAAMPFVPVSHSQNSPMSSFAIVEKFRAAISGCSDSPAKPADNRQRKKRGGGGGSRSVNKGKRWVCPGRESLSTSVSSTNLGSTPGESEELCRDSSSSRREVGESLPRVTGCEEGAPSSSNRDSELRDRFAPNPNAERVCWSFPSLRFDIVLTNDVQNYLPLFYQVKWQEENENQPIYSFFSLLLELTGRSTW